MVDSYDDLPRLVGKLEAGDVVWIGFHSHMISETKHVFPMYRAYTDIAWVVLITRCGGMALDILGSSVEEDQWSG